MFNLTDFGCFVVQLDGNSHVVYAEEEAAGTRLLIDGRTCLLQVRNLIPDYASALVPSAALIRFICFSNSPLLT